jgi:isopentenyl diphosphate isomerase/L-lactate dehydrogenase-like FMN-dependent dehydrogenase
VKAAGPHLAGRSRVKRAKARAADRVTGDSAPGRFIRMTSARAGGAKGHLLILSTGTTTSVEDVISARGGPIWYQLSSTNTWRITQALVKRAEAAGCPVVVLTVDLPAGRARSLQRASNLAICRSSNP